MSEFIIEAEPRTETGSSAARRLRAEGIIPAIIYGGGMETRHVQVDNKAIRRVLRRSGSDAQFSLKIGDTTREVRIQELVRHVTRGSLIHIDFIVVE